MIRKTRVAALLASTALPIGLALAPSMAAAQTRPVPPQYVNVDSRGVDLISGVYVHGDTDVAIGSGPGQLSYGRTNFGAGWSDGLQGTISCPSTCDVSVGGGTEKFDLVSGAYVARDNTGSTLTFGSGTALYTTAGGVAYAFTEQPGIWTGGYWVTEVRSPNGLTETYHYVTETGQFCIFSCIPVDYARLHTISNNAGYALHFDYVGNNVNDTATWWKIQKVTGYNQAVDYCSLASPSCTFSRTWPSAQYSSSTDVHYVTTETVTDQSGRTKAYQYSAFGGPLTAIRDLGATTYGTTIAYSGGRVAQITGAAGTWNYAFNDTGYVLESTATGPLGQSNFATVDWSVGQVTLLRDAQYRQWHFDYSNGRIWAVQYPEGNQVHYTYDTRGNVMSAMAISKPGQMPYPITTSATYDATCANLVTCNLPLTTTDAQGGVTDYTYDPVHGGLLTVTAPAPTTTAARPQTRITYAAQTAYYKNSSGVIAAAPTSIVLPVEQSACATLASCDGTANEVLTTATYGGGGGANNLNATVISQGSGAVPAMATSTVTYTATGDIETMDGPLAGANDTTRFRYDDARQLVGVIGPDPDGAGPSQNRAQRLTYDGRGLVTRTQAGVVAGQSDTAWSNFTQTQRVDTGYDAHGRVQFVERITSGVTPVSRRGLTYDAAGRLMCDAVRMTMSSATLDNACYAEGPSDRIKYTTYDSVGRPLTVTHGYGTPEAATETVTYTLNGQPASVTDANGNVSVTEYDGLDRPIRIRYPAPGSAGSTSTTDYAEFGYDTAGNVVSQRNRAGQTTTTTYDALNRPTFIDAPSGTMDVAIKYDNLGRVLTYANASQNVIQSYDALSRIVSEGSPLGLMGYQYDAAGHMTRITWPDGYYAQYDYDVSGALTAIRENGASSGPGVLATYTYTALGQPSTLVRGNGTITSWGYDAHGRMTSLSHDAAGTAGDVTFGYTWNPAGQIQSRTVSNASYNYAPGSGVVGYDNDGLNRLTSVGGTAVTYDANHNIVTAQGSSYGYDASNRLTSATIGGSGYSFGYDPASRLYSSSSSGLRFQYSGQQLVGEYNSSGALLARHIPGLGLDMPVASLFAGGARYQPLADERGSVVGLTDASANSVGVNVYDEYGVAVASDRFQYTGQALLAPGLYYYRARAYAPGIGRFLQTDPIGYAAGMNIYAYVGGDPVNATDPQGLSGTHITIGRCMSRGGFPISNPDRESGDEDHDYCVSGFGGGIGGNGGPGVGGPTSSGGGTPNPFCAAPRPSALDPVVRRQVGAYNQDRNLSPGDTAYLPPNLIIAMVFVESRWDAAAFANDPMQVNNPGDWATEKGTVAGLTQGVAPGQTLGVFAGIMWLDYKAYVRSPSWNSPRTFKGWDKAVERYNGGGVRNYNRLVNQALAVVESGCP